MTVILAAIAQLAWILVPQAATDEEVLRALVHDYYDAQNRKDADKAAAFWSTSVNPRMTRESYLAVFGAGDAEYTPEIQRLIVTGSEARLRVAVAVARTIVRNDVPGVIRQTLLNAQLWRKEGASWKLVREGPFAEDFADTLIAATPADRARLMAENPADLDSSLRYVLAQRASMLAGQMQYTKAVELFELALSVARASRDRRAESETLQNIANAYYFQATTPGAPAPAEAFAKAAEYYGQRRALAREMADEEATAASLLGLATVAYSRGDYTPAVGFYRDALAIYEKRDEGPSIGRVLVSVGNVQYLQAEYDPAAASYRRALGLLTGLDRQGTSLARSGLARVFAAHGDLAAALDMYGQVLADARSMQAADPRTKSAVANALGSIGEIYYRLGNADQARGNFEEARKLSERDLVAVGRFSASLGMTELVASRFEAALAAYTESRVKFEQAKDSHGVARAWVGIGFSQAARERWADAMAAYRTAIRMFDDQKKEEDSARAWLGLSMAQSGASDHTAALESARKVGATAEKVRSSDLTWRASVRAGDALRRLQRLAESRAEFQQAIAAIDALAADAPVNPEVRSQLDDSASAWAGLAMVLATEGHADDALAALEARRAHARRMQLAAFQRDITRGMSDEEQADEQGIVRELISTRAQLRAERDAPHPDAARLARFQDQLATLTVRRADQQARLYARLPDLQQWRALQPHATELAALAADTGTLVVEYLLGDDELLVVTAARGETAPDITAAIVPVKRRELAEQLAQALQPSVLKDAVEWRTRAAPLAAALVAPIAARLAGRDRCVVVPDDLLWKVPFEALPSGDGVLASTLRVTYATSLATLGVQRRLAAAQTPPDRVSAAIVTAPSIPPPIRHQLSLAQNGWKEPDEEVSLQAAAALGRIYGEAASVTSRAEATEAVARAALDRADVLQFAGPLHVSGAAPMFSVIVLNGAGDAAENDGRWEVREWFRGSSHARVLVVSDGSSFGAAGVGGAMDTLAWAAAAAGVPAVVAGRWPADGFAPDVFAAAFHAALAKGKPPGEAWSAAIAAARAKNGDAPAGWSGWRLIGAG